MSPPTVLLVGKRSGALQAAARLGFEVVLISRAPPARGDGGAVVQHLPVDEADPDADWGAVADRLTGRPLRAALALTERAVVPAALLRQRLGLPGPGPDAALAATDKLHMKRRVRAAGLACADFAADEARLDPDALVAALGLPLVLKPRASSGGRGTRIVRRREELPRTLAAGWMAERLVDGVEMSAESLVRDGRVPFFSVTEYFEVRWANIVPAALPPAAHRAVEEVNRRALAALGIDRGFTHLEVFARPEGLVFGELAARPPGGHITDLIEAAYGFDPWQAWLELEVGADPRLATTSRRCAGVWVLHPGPGRVVAVRGLAAARAAPGVERVVLRLRPGQRVGERLGAGQEKGHILVTGADREQVAERLTEARRRLVIEVEGPAPPTP